MQADRGPALVCRALERFADHLVTSRVWPLGSRVSEGSGEAWGDVARAMKVDTARLRRVHQVHGAAVAVQRTGEPPIEGRSDADIIISNDPRTALAVQTADCVPLLIADPRSGAVAVAHAGWRGLAAAAPAAIVNALAREFGARCLDLVAAVGPSIGACCYEVGPEVRERFEKAGFDDVHLDRWFHERPQATTLNPSMSGLSALPRSDHWFFDAWAATRDQLAAAGVRLDQIHVAELCTASHPEAFCSFRRDGKGAGRVAAAIRVKSSYGGSA